MAVSVYGQLINAAQFPKCLKSEIGVSTNCTPFINKSVEAFSQLPAKMTEWECRNAANVFLSGMQTLYQGGILPEDYDKIDFVKRGKSIVPSARVEAFYRAAARKGYRMSDTIVAVPTQDAAGTYFEENFHAGQVVFVLKDSRKATDRRITAERVAEGYFYKYIIRLNVHAVATNQMVASVAVELYNDELLAISATSDQGIFKARWVEGYGGKKARQVSKEINTNGFWYKWTNQMVQKTLVRQALRRVKETLPELKTAIYAFEHDEEPDAPAPAPMAAPAIEVPVIEVPVAKVDFKNLTEEQKEDCREMKAIYTANPIMQMDDALDIKKLIEDGKNKDDIVSENFARVFCLHLSKSAWELLDGELGGYFE